LFKKVNMKKISLFFVALILLQFSHAQNVGIGTTTPGFPLNFSNALGDKISLYGNTGNHYGLGIQSGLLQIHTDLSLSNIAFGYGSSNNFTERMRILNNGNYDGMSLNGRLLLKNGSTDLVGGGAGVWLYKANNSGQLGFMGTQNNQNIGFYGGPNNGGWGFVYDAINSRVGIGASDPKYLLDVNGRIRIRHANAEEPGIWLNNSFNSSTPAFIGLQNNDYVGFYGGYGAGWAFTMNTVTGALKINGSEGTAGQVLKSNGAGASPSWGSGFDLYNNTEEIGATGIVTIAQQTSNDIPGLTKTITIASPAKVIVEFNLGVDAPSCAFCGISKFDCIIMINGNNTNRIRYEIINEENTTAIGKRIFSLAPGTYTFSLRLNNLTGPSVRAGYYSPNYTSYLFVQTIPQ
jgi:hypothetical protein